MVENVTSVEELLKDSSILPCDSLEGCANEAEWFLSAIVEVSQVGVLWLACSSHKEKFDNGVTKARYSEYKWDKI